MLPRKGLIIINEGGYPKKQIYHRTFVNIWDRGNEFRIYFEKNYCWKCVLTKERNDEKINIPPSI